MRYVRVALASVVAYALVFEATPAGAREAVVDARGDVVCGVSPDEAVAVVYRSPRSGLWVFMGVLGALATMGAGHPHETYEDAVASHEPNATYVCEVEFLEEVFRKVPARFYRLSRPLRKWEPNERGEMMEGEIDIRRWIVGVPEDVTHAVPDVADRMDGEFSQCIAEVRRVDEERGMMFVRIESTCKELAFVRFCLLSYFDPMVGSRMPASCTDRFIEPGEGTRVTVLTTSMDWRTSWKACAGDRDRSAEEHECYWDPNR